MSSFCLVCGSPRPAGVAACQFCGAGASGSVAAAPRPLSPPDPSAGAPYAPATFVSGGHVNGGPSGHITWRSYHTVDPVERVVEWLRATRGSAGYDATGPSHVFRDPPVEPCEVIDVFPPGVPCSFRPAHLNDGCLILRSEIARPSQVSPPPVPWPPPAPPPPMPPPPMPPPAPPTQGPPPETISLYFDGLEDSLPERYATETFVMGRICGLLETLWHLNQNVNHSASIGFLEIEVGEREPLVALRERYAHVEGLALAPIGDWRGAVRGAVRSVALDDYPLLHPLREQLERVLDSLVLRLGELFGYERATAYALSSARPYVYGYINDQTLALVCGRRLFVLGLGWSD